MQKGKVLNLSRLKITDFLIKNKVLLISLILFLLGIIFGIFSFGKYQSLNEFSKDFISEFIALRVSEKFSKILITTFFRYLLILVIFSVFGTSMFGVVTVPLLLCFAGVIYGDVTAYLYSEFALKGIAFNAVVFIPSVMIFLIVLVLACKESVNFSIKISSLTFSKSLSFNLSIEFKKFIIMFIIFIAAVFFCAILDAIISCSFIKYFQF